MRVRVQMFGVFAVSLDGSPLEIRGQTERRILARLCLAEHGLTRKVLGEELWPDIEFASAGNRIRTGLVGLRKAFAAVDPFIADRQSLALNRALVTTDLWRAQDADRANRRAFEVADRKMALAALVEASREDLLPGWDDDWAASARETWRASHLSACALLSRLSNEAEDHTSGAEWATAALEREPAFSEAWLLLFRSMGPLGRGPEAARRFFAARDANGLKGEAWTDVEAAARAVRKLTAPTGRVWEPNLNETEFLRRSFGRMVLEDPAAAVRFMGHPFCGEEIDHEPAWVVKLIDRLVEATKGLPEHAIARAAATRTYGLVGDRRAVREHSAWTLANDDDLSRRLGTLQVMTFQEILDGEWEHALEHQNAALELADKLGERVRYFKGRAQLGTILWHMGRSEEAFQNHMEAYEGLVGIDPSAPNPAVSRTAFSLALALATRGQEAEAEPWLRRARTYSQGADAAPMATFLDPVAGYVAAVQGQDAIAATLTVQGIVSSMRRSEHRSLEVALDFAAGTLAVWGFGPQATATLALAAMLREGDKRKRTPGEQNFANRIAKLADAPPDRAWLDFRTRSAVAKAVVRQIEEGRPG